MKIADQLEQDAPAAIALGLPGLADQLTEAAAALNDAEKALEGIMAILGRAESNASGNPEWNYVYTRVASARHALARIRGEG